MSYKKTIGYIDEINEEIESLDQYNKEDETDIGLLKENISDRKKRIAELKEEIDELRQSLPY